MRLLFLIFFFISTNSYAECNFRTAEYIKELVNPASIKSIDIEIPKSSKYARNLFKIFSSKSESISNKLKKKFDANLSIYYNFGICHFNAKVRQSGDWKDHIKLENGMPIRSLDVKLNNGNIIGVTRFKLLIPETRNGKNEILATLILRELDFIAPETFEVNVIVNGTKSIMLFQEKAAKELLERNMRREGPIFEGDESLLWSYLDFDYLELEPLALSRLVNDNWFKKGIVSQKIVINSFYQLQRAYLRYARSKFLNKNDTYMEVNKANDNLFNDYNWLLISMNGMHALRPHNRKFYFNSIEDRFEPIYYDGSVSFELLSPELAFDETAYELHRQVSQDLKDKVRKLLSSNILKERFFNRLETVVFNDSFYTQSLNQFINNFEMLSSYQSLHRKKEWDLLTETDDYSWYTNFQNEKKVSQIIVEHVKIQDGNANLYLTNGSILDISASDLSSILSSNEVKGERFTIVPNIYHNFDLKDFKEIYIGDNVVRLSNGIDIKLDESNKKLELKQSNSHDWALLLGGNYSDWKIKFNGVLKSSQPPSSIEQRFNSFGLTGCLTLYKTIIDNAHLEVSDGECEDSLNLIRVQGTDFQVLIDNAFADGLDVDFSNLNISNLRISNAENDCFDLSGGKYTTTNARLINCNDKGISVGEMSTFAGENIFVKGAGIGVSSKDYSQVKIDKLDAQYISSCGEAKRKKQEFGGGLLMIKETTCKETFDNDNESLISVSN